MNKAASVIASSSPEVRQLVDASRELNIHHIVPAQAD
jgi:hypothetical protein